ncbi:MAG: sigma-70 family RNA polymerase sigma factor [Coriobacteriia bacterium]|nr:sigma-70 family RNA polymerase sigma factor [Coriobacteriia bacterium]
MNDDIKQLIQGAMDGRGPDIASLASRFQKMIYINCSLRLDDRSQVEDVAQEVSEQMLAGLRQLRNPEAFTAWLQQIIERSCLRANRQGRSRKSREVELDDMPGGGLIASLVERDASQDPEASFAQTQTRLELLEHIRLLPQAQRVPLILYYFGAMSYRQIADALHVKVGTVSSNISKAKKNLNRQLWQEI